MSLNKASASYRAYVMFILVVVYTFNFIDRQIIGILAIPIKADLALTDTQLGLMGGLAFALFYTALGIPIAMLADRSHRVWIMTVALTVWSAMTALCGTVQNFWQLFAARLGVGVGEAGGVAPAYSLISDYFPQNQRARALSIYSFGIPIGSALGIVFGGVIASKVDWRYAFFAVGIAGIVIAPIFKMTVSEPTRGQYDANHSSAPAPALSSIIKTLRKKPSFWLMAFGASCSSMMGYGMFFWLPSFFVRSYSIFVARRVLVLRFDPADRRAGRHLDWWLAGRSIRRQQTQCLRPDSGGCFRRNRAVLCGCGDVTKPDDNILRHAGADGIGPGLAGTGIVGHPARGAAEHARNGVCGLSLHKQSDRNSAWAHWRSACCRIIFRRSTETIRCAMRFSQVPAFTCLLRRCSS